MTNEELLAMVRKVGGFAVTGDSTFFFNPDALMRLVQLIKEDAEPVAWFGDDGRIRGRVSSEQLEQLCRDALVQLENEYGE